VGSPPSDVPCVTSSCRGLARLRRGFFSSCSAGSSSSSAGSPSSSGGKWFVFVLGLFLVLKRLRFVLGLVVFFVVCRGWSVPVWRRVLLLECLQDRGVLVDLLGVLAQKHRGPLARFLRA
jgi:hypothetical protein